MNLAKGITFYSAIRIVSVMIAVMFAVVLMPAVSFASFEEKREKNEWERNRAAGKARFQVISVKYVVTVIWHRLSASFVYWYIT